MKSTNRRPLPVGTIVAFGCLTAVAGVPLATAAPPPAAEALAAAERGWFGRAEEAWGGAAEAVSTAGRAVAGEGNAALRERFRRAKREILDSRDDHEAEAGRVWGREACTPLWRRDFTPANFEPVVTAGGLVLWGAGRAVHALRVRDGRAPWLTGAGDADATLFPRGAATTDTNATPGSPPAIVNARAYCLLASGGVARRLACLDLSPAAEGRLAWLVDADALVSFGPATTAERGAAFDGPPAADHELCLVVVRSGPPREELALAALDARDGSLCWVARVGPARCVAGLDHARGRRRACFAEDRVVLATHAGAIHAFARTGEPAWTTAVPATAAAVAADSPGPAAVFAGDRVVVAPREASGVIALEPRRGAVAWHSPADEGAIEVLAPAAGGVVTMSRSDGGAARIARLELDSGRTTASRRATGRAAGRAVVASGSVFLPVVAGGVDSDSGTLSIEVLDARTLAPRRPPTPVLDADGGKAVAMTEVGEVHLAAAGGRLVVATGGLLVCLEAAARHGADTRVDVGGGSR